MQWSNGVSPPTKPTQAIVLGSSRFIWSLYGDSFSGRPFRLSRMSSNRWKVWQNVWLIDEERGREKSWICKSARAATLGVLATAWSLIPKPSKKSVKFKYRLWFGNHSRFSNIGFLLVGPFDVDIFFLPNNDFQFVIQVRWSTSILYIVIKYNLTILKIKSLLNNILIWAFDLLVIRMLDSFITRKLNVWLWD